MEFKLFVLNGKNAGKSVAISEESLAGRSEECQIRIIEQEVSRKHCRFTLEEAGLYIEDTSSLNGTYVNSKRTAEKVKLNNGDVILIGKTRLVVVCETNANTLAEITIKEEKTTTKNPPPPDTERPQSQIKADDALRKLFDNNK